jgi:hypothetical protein
VAVPTALIAAALILALAAAACSSAPPVGPTPAGSPSPVIVPGSASPGPTATPLPGDVADALIALGVLDSQIAAAGQALDAAVTAKDLAAMAGAAGGLVNLLDGYAGSVTTVSGYAGSKGLGEAYAKAFVAMRAGAAGISEGVKTGVAASIDAGVKELATGITTYGLVRKALGPLLEQAISQKKMYVK